MFQTSSLVWSHCLGEAGIEELGDRLQHKPTSAIWSRIMY